MELIEKRGATTDYHDPFVPVIPETREHASLAHRRSVDLNESDLALYNAVLIATDHNDVDYGSIVRHAKLVVDTRNACARGGYWADNVIKA
jgi:UDP-N-acetyl-D-glucosamine dehydrogenase